MNVNCDNCGKVVAKLEVCSVIYCGACSEAASEAKPRSGVRISDVVGRERERTTTTEADSCAVGREESDSLDEAISHLKQAITEAARNMALNALYHAERAAELAEKVVKYRMSNPPNDGTQRPGSPDRSLATETRKPGSLK